MRGTLLSIILMIIGAVMMGCTSNIMECESDADCEMDWGWGGDSDAADWDGDFGMTCNLDVSPLEQCEEMASYLDYLPDFLPIDISLDCSEYELMGEGSGWGVCGSSWGFGW